MFSHEDSNKTPSDNEEALPNKALERLTEENQLYRSLLNLSPHLLLIIQDGYYVYGNDPAKKLLELPEDLEANSISVKATISPEYHEAIHERVNNLNKGLSNPPAEFRLVIPSNKSIYIRSTSTPIEFKKRPAYLVTGEDITQERKTNKALKEKEIALNRAQHVANLGTYSFNYSTQQFFWSKEFRNIFQLETANLEALYKKIQAPYQKHYQEMQQQAIQSSTPYETTYKIHNKTGEEIWIHDQIEIEKDSHGQPMQFVGVIQNITHQIKVETDYQNLFQNIMDGFALHEIITNDAGVPIDYRFLTVNPAFETLTSLSRDQVIGKTLLEVLPDSEKRWIETYGQVALDQKAIRFSNYSRALDKHFEVVAFSPRKGQFATIFQDITKRKKSEEKVMAEKERFLNLLNELPLFIYLLDEKHSIKFANKFFQDHIGKNLHDPCFKIISHNKKPCPTCPPMEVFNKGIAKDWIWNSPKGLIYHVYDFPFQDTDGSPLVLEMGIDISAEKKVEDLLKKNLEQLTTLFENLPIPLLEEDLSQLYGYLKDLSRDQDPILLLNSNHEVFLKAQKQIEIVSANEAYLNLCGTKNLEELKSSMETITTPQAKQKYIQAMGKMLRGETHYSCDTQIRDIRGHLKDVSVAWNLIPGYEKDYSKVLVSMTDITQRKHEEKRLLQIQKLEALGTLAGGIAHDFNNLLTGIQGNLSLISCYSQNPAKISQKISSAEKAIFQAKKLTDQLLTFAKGGEPLTEITCLSTLIKDATELTLAGAKSTLELSINPDLSPCLVDPGQITQVIQNLTINALQAMPNGGKIKITGKNITQPPLSEFRNADGPFVEISIEDNGLGIPPTHLLKIFEPYFSTKEQGSGLGLAICYSILKKHKGTITVESILNQGTTFKIYLPATSQAPLPLKKNSDSSIIPHSLEGVKILILEDEEINKDLLEDFLNFYGAEVISAKEGKEAIIKWKEEREKGSPVHLGLLDLTIPGGIGGKEALLEILQIDPTFKAIVISGYSTDPTLSNFQKHGFQGMITKPYRLQELLNLILKIIH